MPGLCPNSRSKRLIAFVSVATFSGHRELHSHLPSEPALRVKALESLLVEKGLLDPNTVDAILECTFIDGRQFV